MTLRRSRSEVRDAPTAERPRERLIRYGPRALTDAELLALILRSGSRGQTALEVAREVPRRCRLILGAGGRWLSVRKMGRV